MSSEEATILREKFIEGMKLARRRLVEETKKEDGELIFSKNGKIVRIKARDLKP